MSKNDVVVRTAADLERKYNLGSLGAIKRNIEITAQGIQKIENELNKMLNALVINLKDVLDSQSEISLWFYSGIPTLKNKPYTSWATPSDHIGDIYYDQSSGYVYQYKEVDGVGVWESNVSPDLVEAMAITNSELDTSTDNERKVFFNTPTIPYSNGDWWVKEDGSLFICQISKTTGVFETTDFIDSSNYTESIAQKIGDTITVIKGTVTQISDNFAKFTDLATGKSTTISGDNITSGSIRSNNYVDNVSGTEINLDDGTFNTKNFKVDEAGNVTCNDAIIKGSAFLNGTKFSVDKDGSLICNGAKINGSAIVNGTNFSVDENGNMTCNNGKFNGSINNTNFSVDKDGNINSTAGKIGNWNITGNSLWCEMKPDYDYTESDTERIKQIILGNITPTSTDYKKYDFDKSGVIDALDLLTCSHLVYFNIKNSTPGKLIFDTTDWFRPIKIINSAGVELVGLGLTGVYKKEVEE